MAFSIGLPNKKMLPWHFLGWLVLITYEISFLVALDIGVTPLGLFLSYSLAIALFYIHGDVVMNVTPRKWIVVLVPLEILAYFAIQLLFGYFKVYEGSHTPSSFETLVIKYSYRALYFIMLGSVYWIFMNALRNRDRLLQLEKQRITGERIKTELEVKLVKSQNAKLRSQIEPHFIFNTMNFIYDSVESVSEKAGETILLLSEMMHYAMQKTDDDHEVPLQIELENIKNLIRINNIRTNNRLHIKLETTFETKEVERLKILPLLFITFVENMYKHGDLTDPHAPGIIYIAAKKGELRFKTWNKKRLYKTPFTSSLGVTNARERLKNFYNEKRFNLSIYDNAEGYSVELRIAYAYDKLLYN